MEKNTISINKKMAEKLKQIEVKGDIIVPDTKPDIVNIINTSVVPYIYKEECNDEKYRFDGNVDANIIYLSENGETKCIKTTLDFMDFIEDSCINKNNSTKYQIQIVNVETKILNERKVSVNIKLKICFQFFENKDLEYLDDLNTLTGVEKLQETVNINTIVATNCINSSLKENITIEESDAISEILRNDISICNLENKISYNKVLSKADVDIKILYILENSNKIGMTSVTFPIMNFIDMEKITDEDICNVSYKIRNILIKPSSQELKNIDCQIDFEVACEVYKNKTLEIVQDMYGIDKNIMLTQKNVEIETGTNVLSERVNINENILVEDIRSIYDVDCRANIINKTISGKYCNYEGEVCADIYYDTGNALSVKKAKMPFVVKLEYDGNNIEINFIRKQFRLNNEDVMCDVELEIKSASGNYKTINIIEDIQEEEYVNNNDYAMIVYFVKAGDTVWNIARDFRVTMDSIKKVNNLEDDEKINVGDKLYIMK